MMTITRNIALICATSTLLFACSDDGQFSAQDPASQTNFSGNTNRSALFGGSIAEQYRDATAATTNATNGTVPGSPIVFEGDDDDDDVAPAPPSIGADVPVTYFGPAPSSVNPRLIGPHQLLTAGTVDLEARPSTTVTLPLYQGRLQSHGPAHGAQFWYVVTDTSDKDNAEALGLNFSPKLVYADLFDEGLSPKTARRGWYDADGILYVRSGTVNFRPERRVDVSASDASGTTNLLEATSFQAGAVGSDIGSPDGFYSPLVKIENAGGHLYNAPIVSFDTSAEQLRPYCDGIAPEQEKKARMLLHDGVVSICPGDGREPGTVTLELASGFSFGRPVLYLSTDASAEIAASLEKAVYAPALSRLSVGRDDSLFSSVERIFGFTNGPVNAFNESNPQRQGFNSALRGEGGPLNVLGGIPTLATDYSPFWDLNLGEWTQEAVDNGYRSRLTEEFAILGMVERGFVTGPGGSDYGSSGIIINCPIVQRLL